MDSSKFEMGMAVVEEAKLLLADLPQMPEVISTSLSLESGWSNQSVVLKIGDIRLSISISDLGVK